jgi:hypothetical protein
VAPTETFVSSLSGVRDVANKYNLELSWIREASGYQCLKWLAPGTCKDLEGLLISFDFQFHQQIKLL